MFKITYKQVEGPKRPSVEKYAAKTDAEFLELVERATVERPVQEFLERNPGLVPGAWTPSVKSGHAPLHYALVTQPELPGLRSRVPDFMWIATHSEKWYPTLVEIESPQKRIFGKKGRPLAEFAEARHQLAEWRTWFASASNQGRFIEEYGIPDMYVRSRTMELHMILIYGRRSEFSDNPELSKVRSALLPGADEELMSFDRLALDTSLSSVATVKATGSGRYKVVAVPPTFSTSPRHADRFLTTFGFSDAIEKAAGITRTRKKFLKERVKYWRDWAASEGSNYRGKCFDE